MSKENTLRHFIFVVNEIDKGPATILMNGFSGHEDNFFLLNLSSVPAASDFFQAIHPLQKPDAEIWHCLYGFKFPHGKFRAFAASITWEKSSAIHLIFIEPDSYISLPYQDYLFYAREDEIEAPDLKSLLALHISKSDILEVRIETVLAEIEAWQKEDRGDASEALLVKIQEVLSGDKA